MDKEMEFLATLLKQNEMALGMVNGLDGEFPDGAKTTLEAQLNASNQLIKEYLEDKFYKENEPNE